MVNLRLWLTKNINKGKLDNAYYSYQRWKNDAYPKVDHNLSCCFLFKQIISLADAWIRKD